MKEIVSIFVPLWTGKTKEIKTEIKSLKREIQTIPKDDYYYEGDYDKNKINGKGKLFYNGKLYYDGEWKNGEFSGKGILYQFIGNYKQGLIFGKALDYLEEYIKNSQDKINALFENIHNF